MPKGNKSTAAEMAHRINMIAELMLSGVRSRRRIIQYVRQLEANRRVNVAERTRWGMPWNVADDQLYNYILEATKLFTMSERADLDHEKALQIERFERIYAAAFQKGKYSSAVSALREINVLRGLDQITVNVNDITRHRDALRASDEEMARADAEALTYVEAKPAADDGNNGNGHNGNGNGHAS